MDCTILCQKLTEGNKVNICLIVEITLISGAFGGIVNFLQEYKISTEDDSKSSDDNLIQFCKSIGLGIAAAFIVPLFLETLSSDLINETSRNSKSYLVYTSFCLLASIFSKRFLISISNQLLAAERKAEDASAIANRANIEAAEAKKIAVEAEEKAEEVLDSQTDSLDSNEEIDNLEATIKTGTLLILNSIANSNYRYRTGNALAKEIGNSIEDTEVVLAKLENLGVVKHIFNNTGSKLWRLTKKGKSFIQSTKSTK